MMQYQDKSFVYLLFILLEPLGFFTKYISLEEI